MKTLKEHINESLISHDANKLIDKLTKAFIGKLTFYADLPYEKTGNIKIYIDSLDLFDDNSYITGKLKHNELSTKFYEILNFFNYYITYIVEGNINASEDDYFEWPCIIIEPRYSKNITKKFIKGNRKNNVFYHITRTENVENILKKGLRCKAGKSAVEGGYRYFPDKIFLIADSDYIRYDIDEAVEALGLYGDDFTIIKINLGKRKFDLYKDDTEYFGRSSSSTFVYTYENIPAQMLSIVKYDDLPE